jgi:hypothetical protein
LFGFLSLDILSLAFNNLSSEKRKKTKAIGKIVYSF